MRNAALVLGIIAGCIGLVIGLFSYGWTELVASRPEMGETFFTFSNPQFIRLASVAGPVLAIAGGAMARARALWGGILLLVSAGLVWAAFGFNVATIFPITMAGIGGVLALAAGKPDREVAHF